ncbi:MAG TPA: glycosyltransferase [Campylobacterales bacterium]|nr:glycosyltransferase [Campylobacterales bacterium]
MKIAHITSVHKPNDNRIFYKEVTTLYNNGYDISLIVAGADTKRVNNIDIIGYPKTDGGRFKRMIKTSFIDIIKVCNRVNADIYHFHDPELILVGLYLKLKGKKVVYDIHENNPASILSKPYIKSKFMRVLLSKSFNLFEQISSKFFDALVTARPDITERFKHKNIITLRNFPILPNFSKIEDIKIEKIKPSVVYVGGMDSGRGINELLDSFETLDNYELWLLGPIAEKDLEDRIKYKSKNVRYFGIVEAYEVFSYINQADIGIITFLEAPNHINTLATKPFEYMACGKPLIMSNFEYWQDTFGECSLYVDPSNPKDISIKIDILMKDKELRVKMGNLNKELSLNEYNWEKESNKLLILYKDLEK